METEYEDYRGTDHAGRQVLVTVWDGGTVWVQTRATSWDTWDRPIRCYRINPQTGRTTEDDAA